MNLNQYIKKSHIKAIEKFNAELQAWANETGDMPPYLSEDAFTSFTLWNIRVEDGWLLYECDGKLEKDRIVLFDDEEQEYYECEFDGIMDAIKFWRSCLRKAKKYWQMDSETLDRIYEEEIPDIEDEEE